MKYRNIIGDEGTEQFRVIVFRDGELIRTQKVHDPFIHNTTTIGLSRWDLFKAMFRKQYETCVQVRVEGSEGAVRTIMMLDPEKLQQETDDILKEREQRRLVYDAGGQINECDKDVS